jgi:hypothetical protein
LLSRTEVDALIRAVVNLLTSSLGEAITSAGADFSGRQWLRGKITPESLERISRSFFSVQSLHSPLISIAAGPRASGKKAAAVPALEVDTTKLPAIGVLDTGVPLEHSILARYRRGTFSPPTSAGMSAGPHGCFVSSRIVFGDLDYSGGLPTQTPNGTARYYDVNVSGASKGEIEDKNVYPALQAIVSTAPDVRVFNMSFDELQPVAMMSEVKRSEVLTLVQDLDNFIFQNDVMVVVAAGNSPPGLIPATPYPHHLNTPEWALGPWARSFNSLTCGSYIERPQPGGLVAKAGWPSPFCRVGPGMCDSPKPDFSANGGDGTHQYRYAPGLGVWGLTPAGAWEDWSGTSFAAPLLARECAFAFHRLQLVCERGAYPFTVTVKAFLALTAAMPAPGEVEKELAERTLGRGRATAEELVLPSEKTGVMIWQGVLDDEKDIARVQIPIPNDWLQEASEPSLRLVVAWDPPVNAAVKHLWSTRDVSAKLKTHPDAPALRASTIRPHGTYPMIERRYDLRKLPSDASIQGDLWLMEVAYQQTAEYYAGITFSPQQHVAFAAQLIDEGAKHLSPQLHLQKLPAAQTMTRLTVPQAAVRVPVVLRTS